LTQFDRVLGAGSIAEGETCDRYRASGRAPACVLFPRTVDEVRACVQVAAAERIALVPCGNASHLSVGAPPRRYDAALCVKRLDRILAHEAADMTVTVEAGITLAELDRTLARAGQWLPLDPPRPDAMTVGGLIAADRNGPLRLAHGKVRDLLIGLRVVTGEGALVKGGGRVVKNVAGYDLPKLFAGSFGTLGVIVEATFKIRPRPATESFWIWPARTIAEAIEGALRLRRTSLAPVLLEALNAAGAATIGLPAMPVLVVGFAGSTKAVGAQGDALVKILGDGGPTSATASVPDGPGKGSGLIGLGDATQGVARMLRDFSLADRDGALVARLGALPGALPALVGELEEHAHRIGLVLGIRAHAGSGVAWIQPCGPDGPVAGGAGELAELIAQVVRVATEHRATLIFEAVPPPFETSIDRWNSTGTLGATAIALMAGVKRVLDPRGVLSPGRFVGGVE
jgi:glycolate oxidase FAD binding subunit